MQAVPVEAPALARRAGAGTETITEPAKLLRIASMVRELLEETRQASLDEPGRKRLADDLRAVGRRAGGGALRRTSRRSSPPLAPPMEGVPSESEIRVAQAQLVGWLEGLFHGIQAAMFAQQAAARAQFEELRRRGLPGGQEPPPARRPAADAAASTSSPGRRSPAPAIAASASRRAPAPSALPRLPARRCAKYTGMIDSSITTSATAFTTGCCVGRRMLLKIHIGSVSVVPGQ